MTSGDDMITLLGWNMVLAYEIPLYMKNGNMLQNKYA
jgi:hypothetical protein